MNIAGYGTASGNEINPQQGFQKNLPVIEIQVSIPEGQK